jgi:hypothetical protein
LVPPLTFLLALCGLAAALLVGAAMFTGHWYPVTVLAMSLGAALVGILVNWALEGRLWLTPSALAALPLYLIWKLPVYGRFIAGKRVGWVRTERN